MLWRPLKKTNVCVLRPRLCSSKGAEKMYRENTSPGLRLIVQMKGGKQNLERVYNFLAMGLSVAP